MTSYISSGVSLLQDTATAAMHRVRAMGETATTVARGAMTVGITLASRTAAAGAMALSGGGLLGGVAVAGLAVTGAIVVRTVDEYMRGIVVRTADEYIGGMDRGERHALIRESIVSAAILSSVASIDQNIGAIFVILGLNVVDNIRKLPTLTHVEQAIAGACFGATIQIPIRNLYWCYHDWCHQADH